MQSRITGGTAHPWLVLLLLLPVLIFAAGSRAQGDKPAEKKKPIERPDWLDEMDKTGPGTVMPLDPCTFELTFSWSNLVTAGRANVLIGDTENPEYPGHLIARAEGGSAGLARALYKYNFTMWGALDPDSLKAVKFNSVETGKDDVTKTDNSRDKYGVLSLTEIFDKKGKSLKTRRIRFPFDEAYDLLGALLYLRSLEFTELGETASVIAHPFGGAYLVHLTYEGREKHDTAFSTHDCLRFKIGVEKLTKGDGVLIRKKYEKFERATLWVSDDEYRLPIEVEAKIFIGSIRATMSKRFWLDPAKATAEKKATKNKK